MRVQSHLEYPSSCHRRGDCVSRVSRGRRLGGVRRHQHGGGGRHILICRDRQLDRRCRLLGPGTAGHCAATRAHGRCLGRARRVAHPVAPDVLPTATAPSVSSQPAAPTAQIAPKTATAASNTTRLALRSLAVQSVIRAGGSGKITVCLTGIAPKGGAAVTLRSNRPSILPVPAQAVVPAGKECVSITVSASRVTTEVAVNVTALYGGARITKGTVVRPMASTPTATSVASPAGTASPPAAATKTSTPKATRTPTPATTGTPAPSATAKPGPGGRNPIRAMFYYPCGSRKRGSRQASTHTPISTRRQGLRRD